MDFGKVLTRAWEIIWKHKILWVFGLFASCSGPASSASFRGGGGGGTGYQYDGGDYPFLSPEYQRFFRELSHLFEQNIEAIFTVGIILFLVFLVLGLFFYLLSNLGKVGLIRGTLLAEGGADRMTFNQIFEESKPFFWRIVGLNLLVAVVFLVAVIVMWMIFGAGLIFTFGLGLFCLIPLICLMVPFIWFLGIVLKQANIALVLEDLDIMAALKRGWHFTREHLGNMIVMGIILYIGGAIIGFIVGLPQVFSIIPLFTGLITGEIFSDPEVLLRGITATVVMQLLYLPIFLALRAVLVSYIESAWTLNYLENLAKTGLRDEEPPQLGQAAPA